MSEEVGNVSIPKTRTKQNQLTYRVQGCVGGHHILAIVVAHHLGQQGVQRDVRHGARGARH